MNNITVSILYDNTAMEENMQCGWGFGALVRTPYSTVLFDTGSNGQKLLANCHLLEIDPAVIDSVVISHAHNGHTGGLWELLRVNSDITLYLPGNAQLKNLAEFDVPVARVFTPIEVETAVYSTGIIGNGIAEQALILHTEQGIVILTGCAHPGVLAIIQTAISEFPYEPILHVIGGLHLYNDNLETIEILVRECRQIGVQAISPGHCSGEDCRRIFKQNYQENYYEVGSGVSLSFPGRKRY